MEHWKANKKYNGQSMPTYSGVSLMCKEENCSIISWIEKLSSMYWVVHFLLQADLQQFRQDYIIDWVMDPQNIHRDDVLYAIQYNTYVFPSVDW